MSRRTLPAALALLLLTLSVVPVTAAPSYAGVSYSASREASLTVLLNSYRTGKGLRPYARSARLDDLARTRAGYLLSNKRAGCSGWFSHDTLVGCQVTATAQISTLLENNVSPVWSWTEWGENIAWNSYPDDLSTAAALRQFQASPAHNALMLSSAYNYVGIGSAKDSASGIKTFVMVFLRAHDVTPPRVTSLTAVTASSGATVVRWHGSDTFLYRGRAYALESLNAGLANYDLRYRAVGATTWTVVRSRTTATSLNLYLRRGVRYQISVIVRDRNDNLGSQTITYRR